MRLGLSTSQSTRFTAHPQTRVFLDLEYCYPGMTLAKGRPGEQERRKIVQISAIRFDMNSGKEVDRFDVLVKPIFQSKLPRFFVELTGITNQMVKSSGVHFKEAITMLCDFCVDQSVWTFNADWNVLRQNCSYLSLPFPFANREFIRVKQCLPSWGVDPDKYSSGTLHQAAGIEMHGHVHNALHDVRSMARAVHAFEARHGNQSV